MCRSVALDAVYLEVLDGQLALTFFLSDECHGVERLLADVIGKVFVFHADWRFVIPVGDISNPVLALVGHVETQLVDNVLHQQR